LIRLPKDLPPIVEFNNEFGWRVKPKLTPGLNLEETDFGHPVFSHELAGINKVSIRNVSYGVFGGTGTPQAVAPAMIIERICEPYPSSAKRWMHQLTAA
jgi:hypothetical protein